MGNKRSIRKASQKADQVGSAYVVTLLVLFVLTILGLNTLSTTQTEKLLGSNERTIQRVFYAADSGIRVATARLLVDRDHRKRKFAVSSSREVLGSRVMSVYDEIESSPIVPIMKAPCALCQVNQGSSFWEVNHSVTAVATRFGAATGDGLDKSIPMGRKTVSVMVELQPWPLVPEDFFVENPNDLDLIRF